MKKIQNEIQNNLLTDGTRPDSIPMQFTFFQIHHGYLCTPLSSYSFWSTLGLTKSWGYRLSMITVNTAIEITYIHFLYNIIKTLGTRQRVCHLSDVMMCLQTTAFLSFDHCLVQSYPSCCLTSSNHSNASLYNDDSHHLLIVNISSSFYLSFTWL